MFQATSLHPYRDYQDAIAYLRQKYRQDMTYREHLLASNPFLDPEAQKLKQQTKNNQGCICSQQEDQ